MFEDQRQPRIDRRFIYIFRWIQHDERVCVELCRQLCSIDNIARISDKKFDVFDTVCNVVVESFLNIFVLFFHDVDRFLQWWDLFFDVLYFLSGVGDSFIDVADVGGKGDDDFFVDDDVLLKKYDIRFLLMKDIENHHQH